MQLQHNLIDKSVKPGIKGKKGVAKKGATGDGAGSNLTGAKL